MNDFLLSTFANRTRLCRVLREPRLVLHLNSRLVVSPVVEPRQRFQRSEHRIDQNLPRQAQLPAGGAAS